MHQNIDKLPTQSLFDKIIKNNKNNYREWTYYHLLKSQKVLWPTYPYQLPLSKATCYWPDFVPYSISKKF